MSYSLLVNVHIYDLGYFDKQKQKKEKREFITLDLRSEGIEKEDPYKGWDLGLRYVHVCLISIHTPSCHNLCEDVSMILFLRVGIVVLWVWRVNVTLPCMFWLNLTMSSLGLFNFKYVICICVMSWDVRTNRNLVN